MTWTTLDTNGLLPGEPFTSAKALAFYGNPIALAEGAAGAPRIFLRSLERLQAGNEIRSRRDGNFVLDGSSQSFSVSYHAFSFIQYGTIRATISRAGGNGSMSIVRLRNGAETTLASATVGTLTADVDVIPGDQVFLRAGVTFPNSFTVNLARFQTNGQDLWPGSSLILEGNRSAT